MGLPKLLKKKQDIIKKVTRAYYKILDQTPRWSFFFLKIIRPNALCQYNCPLEHTAVFIISPKRKPPGRQHVVHS